MEMNTELVSRKRKLQDSEVKVENSSKKKFVEENLLSNAELLDLADETLIKILNFLDGESLLSLGSTCTRMQRLSCDRKLWSHATFNSKELNILDIMKRLRYIIITTKSLELRGNCTKESINTRLMPNKQTFKEIIKRIVDRSPLIENLHFSQICFDWSREFSMSRFPSNLKSLTFSNCLIPQNRTRVARTFTGIQEALPNLETLKLEFCNFFEPNDLMAFSKLPNLKQLSLRGCVKMRSSVPYLSLACRFGFQRLESFDLRETRISDGELQCLNSIRNLREIYLEFPEIESTGNVSDDEDDDLRLFMRRSNVRQHPRRVRNDVPLLSSLASQSQPTSHENEPSTSSASVNISPPSSPDNFSDSIHSSSDSDDEQGPTRTIVIRANINPNNNPGENNEPRIQVIIGNGEIPQRYLQMERNRRREMMSITDRGMLAFGVARVNVVWLGNQPKDPNTYLERIVLRKYSEITDATLLHLETNAPRLVYLDVRGCGQISREAVDRFKIARINCNLLSDYDIEE